MHKHDKDQGKNEKGKKLTLADLAEVTGGMMSERRYEISGGGQSERFEHGG